MKDTVNETVNAKSKIIRIRHHNARCGDIGIVLFDPKQNTYPILLTMDLPGASTIYHLSVSDAEQLRDNLINTILESNDIEVPEPDGV